MFLFYTHVHKKVVWLLNKVVVSRVTRVSSLTKRRDFVPQINCLSNSLHSALESLSLYK